MKPFVQEELFAPDELAPSEPPPTPRQALAPTAAVLAVAVAAIAAAVMSHRSDVDANARVAATAPSVRPAVVTAPPLVARHGKAGSGTQALGGPGVCATCGVVESVVVAAPHKPGFRMLIRMDDGSMRTVEQRAALPAGSRVAVGDRDVKLIPG